MEQTADSHVWETDVSTLNEGVHSLVISIEDEHGNVATEQIRVVSENPANRER